MSANFCMIKDRLSYLSYFCLTVIQYLPCTPNVVKNWNAKTVCKTVCICEKLTFCREIKKKKILAPGVRLESTASIEHSDVVGPSEGLFLASLLPLFTCELALFYLALPMQIRINKLHSLFQGGEN